MPLQDGQDAGSRVVQHRAGVRAHRHWALLRGEGYKQAADGWPGAHGERGAKERAGERASQRVGDMADGDLQVRNEIAVLKRVSMGHQNILTLVDYFETMNNCTHFPPFSFSFPFPLPLLDAATPP